MRTLAFTLMIAMGSGLAGCANPSPTRGLESVHQPVVERSTYVMDVAVDGNGITYPERQRLDAWLDAMHVGYGDRLAIDFGDDYNVGARHDLDALAAHYGMLVADTAPVTPGRVQPGTARVILSRSRASVPGCPNWKHKSESYFNGGTFTNFGCGVNSTIAAMVADPEDLVAGRTDRSDVDGGRQASKAIDAYHTQANGKADAAEAQSTQTTGAH